MLQAAFAKAGKYQARRGYDSEWVAFTVPMEPDGNGGFELPTVLGHP